MSEQLLARDQTWSDSDVADTANVLKLAGLTSAAIAEREAVALVQRVGSALNRLGPKTTEKCLMVA